MDAVRSPQNPADIIRYYQELGFFARLAPEELVARYEADRGRLPRFDSPWHEARLLAYDREQCWCDDPEADVCRENQVYVATLQAWAWITAGSFTPEQVAEHWATARGPIRVTYRWHGESFVLSPEYRNDWIDLKVIGELNRQLAGLGPRFNYAQDGNFCLVTFLEPAVEERLRRERGFPFALPPGGDADRAPAGISTGRTRRASGWFPERLDRGQYLVRWLASLGLALGAGILSFRVTAGTRREWIAVIPGTAWAVFKMLLLDPSRLRSIGWSPWLTLLNLLLPVAPFLQLLLWLVAPEAGP